MISNSVPPILRAHGLCYRIRTYPIVRDFHLQLAPGQVVGLIGPNGAGKTTVLDLLSGLSLPEKGTILIGSQDVTRLPPYRRTQAGMARTFQESPAVRHLTVFEHLQLSCEATAGSRAGLQSAAPEELLTRFGLEDSKDRLGGELPTTDRRLLDLARAVGTGPKVLLLDEPFSGLESDQVRLVMREIERLQANAVSVLIVEHRLALLGSIAQSVVAILAGTPVAQGSLAEVLHNPEVQAAFLGPEIRAEKADHANPVDR